jgi:beta-lactamase class A
MKQLERRETFRVNQTSPLLPRSKEPILLVRSRARVLAFLSLWLPLTLFFGLLFVIFQPAHVQSNPKSSVQNNVVSLATTPPTSSSLDLPQLILPALPTATTVPVPTSTPLPIASLQQVVTTVYEKYKGGLGKDAEFGFLVHNIDTGEKYGFNTDKLFETGSVYKLFVMLTVLHDISQRKLTLETPLVLSADVAKYTIEDDGGVLILPIGGSMSVKNLLENTIVQSNNTTALMLLTQVRLAHMREIVAGKGMTTSNLTDSFNFRTTAQDLDLFFTQLANNKLLGAEYDEIMRDMMLRQRFRSKIPALLPPGTKVVNKVGDYPGVSNDTGLIYLPNGQRYTITMLARQTDANGARNLMQQLSLAVYNYFAKK